MQCWPAWRLVVDGHVASMPEIDQHWTVDDIADANEVLDALGELRREMNKPKPR